MMSYLLASIPAEWVIILSACLVLIAMIPVLAITFFVKRHKLMAVTKMFGITLALLCAALFAADPVRRIYAQWLMHRAQPLIASIESYKQKYGKYPEELPKVEGLEKSPFHYQSTENRYTLRFLLNGPPFGHHFFYHPDHKYESFADGPFELKETVGTWGWFRKF